MATRFVNIDRDTPLLLPPDLRVYRREAGVQCSLAIFVPLCGQKVSVDFVDGHRQKFSMTPITESREIQ